MQGVTYIYSYYVSIIYYSVLRTSMCYVRCTMELIYLFSYRICFVLICMFYNPSLPFINSKQGPTTIGSPDG